MEHEGKEKKKSNLLIIIVVSVVVLIGGACFAGVLAAIIVPNFVKARATGELAACESNLKNIATALEMSATDNEKEYPSSLDELVSNNYMKSIPVCPACEKPYIYKNTSAGEDFNFELSCGGEDAHTDAGAGRGHYPLYRPKEGIVLR